MLRIAVFLKLRLGFVWSWLISLSAFRKLVSRTAYKKYASAAPPRPYANDMSANYTSWKGLTNRAYTGRHLPQNDRQAPLPSESSLVDLFLRTPSAAGQSAQSDCIRSSVMFASFAQWFTDSFLRTDHAFDFDAAGNVKTNAKGDPIRLPGRHQRNTSNHEIDLCQIYGLSEAQTDLLRLKNPKRKGRLKAQQTPDGEYPEFYLKSAPNNAGGLVPLAVKAQFDGLHDERIVRWIFKKAQHHINGYETLFAVGLEHGNATLGNTLLNTIFLREHNRVADEISEAHPTWDDDQVFETTRNVMIVLLLKIVICDYIRHISPMDFPFEVMPGFAEQFDWYRTNRISIEFNLLYRWHGLVPDQYAFLPNAGNPRGFLHNNDWLLQTGVAGAVKHFSEQRAGKILIGNTPQFLRSVKEDTIDLMRASKLASYNDYRERFGFKRAASFSDVTKNETLANDLSALYSGDIEALEWYIGMFAEDHGKEMIMGDLLMTMVAHDAFTNALTNPLLSRAVFNEATFSKTGLKLIDETTTLSQLVNRVAGVDHGVFCSFRV